MLAARGTAAVAQGLLRLYRAGAYGTFLWDHDPRLLDVLRSDEPALFAVWHQDFVHTLGYLSRWNPRRRTFVLASASRDGSLAATAATAMGFRDPVRGSTTRGGHRALLTLRRRLENDPQASLAVVCDGPRPPAQVLQPGIVHLAQADGRPLWLVRTSFARKTVLERSWAKFHVPHPFSRGVVRAAGPFHVTPTTDRGQLERERLRLEERFHALVRHADERAAELAGSHGV